MHGTGSAFVLGLCGRRWGVSVKRKCNKKRNERITYMKTKNQKQKQSWNKNKNHNQRQIQIQIMGLPMLSQ